MNLPECCCVAQALPVLSMSVCQQLAVCSSLGIMPWPE